MPQLKPLQQKKVAPPKFHLKRRIILGQSDFGKRPEFNERDLEKKCRMLVQYMDQPVMVTDHQERAIYANPKLCELIGYPLHEILGRKSYDFCTLQTAEKVKKITSVDRRAGMISTYEVAFVTKAGKTIPVTVNGIPLDDGGTVGIFRDLRTLKAAKEEARTNQSYFEQLFVQSADAIAACDANEVVLDLNPAFIKLFGYTQEEARGRHINDLLVPPHLTEGAVDIAKRINQGKRVYLETIRRNKDGRLIDVTVTGASILVEGKSERVGVYAIYRDITERRQAEKALAKSEERYALAARGANDGLWDWNIVTGEKYYSPRFKELLGFKDSDISNEELQKLFPTLVDPADRQKMDALIQSHLKRKTPYDFEYKITLPSGELHYFRSRAQAIWDEKGKPLRMAGSLRDITRRKMAEDQLASSQKLLNDILQGSPVATYVIDMNHKIIIWNKAMERLTGCKAKAMIGTDHHWQVFYGHKRPMIVDYMVRGMRTKDIISKHYRHTNFKAIQFENGVVGDVYFPNFYGGGKWLRFIIKPLYDLKGNRLGAIETAEDINEIKKAEEKLHQFNKELKQKVVEKTWHLEQANKRLQSLSDLKDEFITVTSHELRSPLTSIRGYLSFLTASETLSEFSEETRQYLKRAYNNAEVLNNLVNNILDVSRLESGRFELKKTPVNLVSLLKTILDNFMIQAKEKKLALRLITPPHRESFTISADIIRLHQVFVNLIDNALKYSNPGKSIQVTLTRQGGEALIRIQDQGIGIPKAQLSQVFEKFIRATNAMAHYKGGAGLGLFITRKIVELHGGTITVESHRGRGTTFIVRFLIT